ncbi:MAG: lipoate--protein ligase, partial [Gemmatimonadaceae bacterium]
LLFYVNAPAIIVGRNQNTIEEISADVVAERGIRVVRRISGGGAVYHDPGTLNFSFMTGDVAGHFGRFDRFTEPVVDVLRELGVPAALGGRNDILADGRKISGNAQFASGPRMLSHGTLLVHSNLDDVTAALRPRPGKIESKGMKSIRSRVANIAEFLPAPLDVAELRTRIIDRVFGSHDPARVPTIALDAEDWRGVNNLVARKYGTWTWNYGEDPPCSVQHVRRFTAGEVDLRIGIRHGRVSSIRFFGDFMGRIDVGALEARLIGVSYQRPAIVERLGDLDLSVYFGEIPRDDLIELVCP